MTELDPTLFRAKMALPSKREVLNNCKTARYKERKDGKYTITVDSHRDVEALREMTQKSRQIRMTARSAPAPVQATREAVRWGRRRQRRVRLDDQIRPLRTWEEIQNESNAGHGDR